MATACRGRRATRINAAALRGAPHNWKQPCRAATHASRNRGTRAASHGARGCMHERAPRAARSENVNTNFTFRAWTRLRGRRTMHFKHQAARGIVQKTIRGHGSSRQE